VADANCMTPNRACSAGKLAAKVVPIPVVKASHSSAEMDVEPSTKMAISRTVKFKQAHAPKQKCSQSSVGAFVGGGEGRGVGVRV
jgi:hypothetical protein